LEIPERTPESAAEAKQSSPLVAMRLRDDINRELAGKGLTEVDDGADLLAVYYLGAKQITEIKQNAYSATGVWANARIGEVCEHHGCHRRQHHH
jgi:hypothetical protein